MNKFYLALSLLVVSAAPMFASDANPATSASDATSAPAPTTVVIKPTETPAADTTIVTTETPATVSKIQEAKAAIAKAYNSTKTTISTKAQALTDIMSRNPLTSALAVVFATVAIVEAIHAYSASSEDDEEYSF
jgi:hypothetical protein